MSTFARLLVLLCGLLVLPAVHAFADDYDDNDDEEDYKTKQTRVTRLETPRDRYNAKLEMLNAKVERRRQICKNQRSSGADYCMKEADQVEYEGRRELKDELEAALEKSATTERK